MPMPGNDALHKSCFVNLGIRTNTPFEAAYEYIFGFQKVKRW